MYTFSFAADFTAKSLGDYNNVTVMEVQGNYDSEDLSGAVNYLPRQEIAKEFFKTHRDEYDFLVIFSNFNFQMPESEAKAFYNPVRNDVRGIGIDLFDNSSFYGSSGKLQGTIDMGNLSNIVTDPLDPKFEETLYFLSHEMMHRWGTHVKFKDASGSLSSSLLGRNGDHWSFLLDTSGSALYGNRWQDNGNGTFTSLAPHREMKLYSPLDLYLMGMLDKSQVPPMLLIENPAVDPTRLPEAGVTISGTARHIAIDDITAAEGERVPGSGISQKKFKTAFIFVTVPGTFTGKEIQGIENVRNGGITRFSILTDGKSIMEVASTPREDVPVNPGIILPSTTPRTLPPNIEDGVTWLVNSQTNDGSWLDLSSTTDRDTAEATRVLKNFDIAHASYLNGVNWLNGVNSENNADYLARKIEALTGSGNEVTGLIGKIISMQNADGGWGSERSYSSSPMDTAIVLRALYLAGYSDQGVISKAINYLRSKQNSDGGWGSEDKGSMVQPTSNVLSAFNSYRKMYYLDDRIATGAAWLIGKQNTDGGFGNSPSTVYDTATALLTLAELNTSKDITNKALNYILNSQSGDGSWNESPYQTALAVSAILKAQIDPDLSITSEKVVFIPEKISRLPTNVVINADIANLGRTGAPAKVALFEGDPSLGKKTGEQTLVFPGQSTTTVTFYVEVKDGNEHIYYVVLDPEDQVKESNELNNSTIKILYPESTYDLEIKPSDIAVSQSVVEMYQDVKIISKITNSGTMNAYNVQVRYFIDDAASPFEIATVTLDVVPANATVTNEITWRANKAGVNLPLTVQVDPFDNFAELSEANNKASATLTVNPLTVTDPNLSITYREIAISPVPALERGSAHISAVVRNDGYSAANDIVVNFYKGVPGAGGVLIGTRTVSSLAAGGSATVSIAWTDIRESGEKVIYVQVDPDNVIKEIKEDDNEAFTTMNVLGLPDLTLSTNSISFNPPFPKEGDSVTVNVTIQNKGQQDAKDVVVRAYDGGILIGDSTVPTVPALSQVSVSFNYNSSGKQGLRKLSVIADPDNTVAEQIEDNNSAEKEFGVQNADLWITEQYISPNGDGIKDGTEFFFRLDVPQSVKVVVIGPKGDAVRTFSGGELENSSGGQVTWDGLSDGGTVVADGRYQMQVVSQSGTNLGGSLVVVDNNRSPFQEAIGTDYIQDLSLSWNSPFYGYPKGWFGDNSGILFEGEGLNRDYTQWGLFKYSPGDQETQKLTPDDWKEFEFQADFSPLDGRMAVISEPCYYCSKDKPAALWLFDETSSKWNKIDEGEAYSRVEYWYSKSMLTPRWSPDGRKIAYQKALLTGGWGLFVINPDGTGKTRVDDSAGPIRADDDGWGDIWLPFKWSPSGDKIAYVGSGYNNVWVSNLNGNRKQVYSGEIGANSMFWVDNNKLLVPSSYNEGVWLIDVTNPENNKMATSSRWDAFFVSPSASHALIFNRDWPDSNAVMHDFNSGKSLTLSENNLSNFYSYMWKAEDAWWSPNPDKLWSPDGSKFYLLQKTAGKWINGIYSRDLIMLVLDFNKFEFKEINLTDPGIIEYPERGKVAGIWMNDNKTVLIPFSYSIYDDSGYLMTSIDTESGNVQKTSLKTPYIDYGYTDDFGYSPRGNYIYYYYPDKYASSSYIFRSLMNLTSELNVSKNSSSISLKGTANDINFEGYKLEYADVTNPNTWGLVQPPSNSPVIDDVFTTWIPPYEGTYFVRLTVWDKAGNVLSKQKRVSWGLASSITNLYKTLSIFSPNGDGVKDTVELKYTVLEPVHLEFSIYDQNNILIRTFVKDHAAPGDEFISWDGKDGNGIVVPDGKYKIKVLDYEFFVDVDNTPPDVAVSLSSINTMELTASLKGHALDANMKVWRIDYGEGENPQEWIKLLEGNSPLDKVDVNGSLEDAAIKGFLEQDLGWLGGKKFRITIEDQAGNVTSTTSGFINEFLFLARWDDVRVYNMLPASLTGPGVHEISGFETIGLPISSLKLQYRSGGIWVDSSAPVVYASGSISIGWDTSLLASTVNAVRIKGVDITGREYYSNTLTTENIFTLHTECEKPIVGKNYIFETLSELRYQVRISGESTWLDYKILNGEGIPSGEFIVPFPPSSMTNGTDDFYVRMIATGLNGGTYESDSVTPTCPVSIILSVKHEQSACGSISGKAVVSSIITGKEIIPKTLSYYIQKPDGLQLLRNFDLSSEAPGNAAINTSDMPEGTYDVKAVFSFVKDDVSQEASASGKLYVDRSLPTAKITYPGKSLKVCPVKVSGTAGDKYVIPVEGTAADDRQMKQYEISYGIGDNPTNWLSAKNEKDGQIKGERSVQGELGRWDVTGLKGTDFSIKLDVADAAGNASCSTTNFSMDTAAEITRISAGKTLFSPNSDGVNDDVTIDYEIDEYAKVDIRVFKLVNNILDSTPVKTIASGLQHLPGTGMSTWDGKSDSGSTVPDGRYAVAVSIVDSCGNTNGKWSAVEVDNTLPTAVITYPRPGDPIGNIVEVKGTADDLHFKSYSLEAGQGDNPETWTSISSNAMPVKDYILGKWNTYGLVGKWTLRLTAFDASGNKNTTTAILDLGARKNLIKDISAIPPVISPNNDTKLDMVDINYELTDVCDLKIEIFDFNNALNRGFSGSSVTAGIHSFRWDGKDNSGTVVRDGTYTIRVHAALASNTAVAQDEAITAIVDSTPPVINLPQPLEGSFIKTDLPVTGSIKDSNLVEYSISYVGPTEITILDQANQSREGYTFGILDLPDGNYTLTAKAGDIGENIVEKNITFTVDRTPPKVSLDTPKDGEYYGPDRDTVDIAASIAEKNLDIYNLRYGLGDNPAQWTDLSSGNAVPANPLFSWKVGKADNVPDGLYTLWLYAKDKAGSTSEARVKVTVDNTPPEALITVPQDGGYIKDVVEIKGTASDQNLDSYKVEVSEGKCNSAFKWVTVKTGTTSVKEGILASWQATNGDLCLRVSVVDKVGNKGEAKVNIKADTSPPASPVLTGKIDGKTGIRLDWSGNTEPDLAGFNIYRDGRKINPEPAKGVSFIEQNLVEAVYAYTITAVDLAGWESRPSNEVKLKVDVTGPTVQIRSHQEGSKVGGTADIKGTAASDDFKQYKVYLGQGLNPSSWNLIRTSPLPVSYGTLVQWDTFGLNEGVYSIKLEAEDLLGNISFHQVSVEIDNSPPAKPTLISATASSSNVSIQWQASVGPDLAGYLLFRNDKQVGSLITGTSYLDSSLPDGKFTYYIIAKDQAGNMSEQSNSIDVNIDTHPPHVTIVEPYGWAKFENKLLVKAESNDTDVANVQFQYKNTQDTSWTTLGSVNSQPFTIYFYPKGLGLPYGEYYIQAIATDIGGKTDPYPSYIYVSYADLTFPAAPSGLRAIVNGRDVTFTWNANTETDLNGYRIYNVYNYWYGTYRSLLDNSVIKGTTYTATNLSEGEYTFEITAVDNYGNESNPSSSVTARVYSPWIAQPPSPTEQKDIQITGGNAEPNSSVEIFIDSGSGAVSQGTATSEGDGNFSFNVNLSKGENSITARVRDSVGNVSITSYPVIVVYSPLPQPPTGLSASVLEHNVALTWNSREDLDIAGYNIYRNEEKINIPAAITGGKVGASASDDKNPPSNAFDSSESTYWSSPYGYGKFTPVWWEAVLPSIQDVKRIGILWGSELYYPTIDSKSPYDRKGSPIEQLYAGYYFEIQVWLKSSWVTVERVSGNYAKENVIDLNQSYRTDKIRIYIYETTDWSESRQVRISEVTISGSGGLLTQTSFDDLNLADGKYTYTVTSVNNYGRESLPSNEAKVIIGDATAPSAPLNLTATPSDSHIILNWSANTEPDVAGYYVYRKSSQGWLKISRSLSIGTNYTDSNLPNGIYTYMITAVDAAGNESISSDEASAAVYITPPQAPSIQSITSISEGGALSIIWDTSSTSAGFNIYRGMTSGGPYAKVNPTLIMSNSYIDSGLLNGSNYYYVVTAVDHLGNESNYSTEAIGIPVDTIAPSAPQIFFPTVSALPIVSYINKVNISGNAEPGADIELFKDGILMENGRALDKDEINSINLSSNFDEAFTSPDGKILAYAYNNGIWLKDLMTGTEKEIIQHGYSPVWSPDAKKIAYYDGLRLAIYDMETGISIPLTGEYVYEYYPSWSSDGTKIAFLSYKDGAWNVWLKDMVSGLISRVTNDGSAVVPKISPDGTKVADIYFLCSISSCSSMIKILNISDGTTSSVSVNDAGYITWSSDSTKIVYNSYRNGSSNIYVLDVDMLNETQITSGFDYLHAPASSPDRKSLAYIKNSSSVWITSLTTPGEERLLSEASYVQNLTWLKSGEIVYISDMKLNRIYPKGYFGFKDASLDFGENMFTAKAIDSSSNISPSSEAISVTFDASTTPDLETTEESIVNYPLYPISGEKAAVNVLVVNNGQVEVKDVDVDIYIWDSTGSLQLIKSENIHDMLPNSEKMLSVVWDTTGKIGTNSIIVVVDPDDKIAELSELNNYAVRDLFVMDKEGVSITTILDARQYNSDQDAHIEITLRNSGAAKNITLETRIEDGNGYLVEAFEPNQIALPYGQEKTRDLIWNTGSTYAGAYKVHTTVKEGLMVISEEVIPFTILPDMVVNSAIVTDKLGYGPEENITISVNITNSGRNYILPALKANVSITNESGSVIYTENRDISNLMPGATVSLASIWNTALNMAGDYNATFEASIDGRSVSSETRYFKISAVPIVSGSIVVGQQVVPVGGAIQVNYSLKNSGNADASGIATRVLISDPETNTVLANHEETITLAREVALNRQLEFSTENYDLKKYSILLQSLIQGTVKNLANTSFVVKDLTPPAITIVSPLPNSTYDSTITASASVNDNASGIDRVEYQIDGGQWNPLPSADLTSNSYSTKLDPKALGNGTHTIGLKATDKSGNVSMPVSSVFNIDFDDVPPLTILNVLMPKYEKGDLIYVTNNTQFTLNANDDISGVKNTEYRVDGGTWIAYAPFNIGLEGSRLIEYRSTDNAGNTEAARAISVAVDNTPPVTNITTGTPNYTVQDGRIFVTSSTQFTLSSSDSGAGVKGTEYRIDGGNWVSYAPFTLQGSGNHLIEYRAIDNVENTEATRSLAVVVDDTPPVTEITATGAKYPSTAGIIYVTKDTAFTLTASDDLSGVAKTEYRIDNGAWTAYAPFAVTVEGEHTISYRSSDNLGNLEGAKVYTVIVDNTPPISEITVGSPKHTDSSGTLFITGETTMTITASDSSSGVAHTDYRVDGGQWQAYEPFRISAEGHHVIEYRSADNVANTEEPKNLSAAIDNTPPTTEISVGMPKFTSTGDVLYVTGVTTFTLAASDNLSGVQKTEYRIDGGEWHASVPFTIAAEGSHLIEYRSSDNVGNLENIRSLSIVVDNTPPVSNLTLGTPKHEANGSIYISGSTSFTLSSSDNLSGIRGIEYRVDGGQWTEYTVPFNLSALPDGQHTIHYRASDNVGNIESEKTLAFIIDNTPPETAITVSMPKFTGADGGLYVTKDTEFTLSSTDNLSGVSRVEYRIDNGVWTEYSAFKISSEGSHVIGFRSTDNIGNTETEKTLSVTVDNTPPVSSIATGDPKHTASDGTLFVTASTAFTLTATDSLSGVKSTEYRVDSGTWTAYTSPFSVPAEGSRLIEYRSLDNVGNLETIKSISVTVDNTPPVTALTVGSPKHEAKGGIYVTAATQFTLSPSDNLSGVNRTEYRVDGGEWIGYAGAFNLTSLSDGQHSVGYRSIDNLGNMETEKTLSIVVDNTPPVTDIHVSEPRFSTGGNLFVTKDTEFTLTSSDNLSGIAKTEYRIDGSQWTVYAPFKVATEGNHTIEYRSADNVGNEEAVRTLAIVVDNTPPSTEMTVGTPKYTSSNGAIYVTGATTFTLSASDNLSGVKVTEYRVDGGAWTAYSPFSIGNEGSHLIEYRSADNVGNIEQIRSLTVTVDNTPPVTSITSGSPKYETENTLYVAGKTIFTLSSADNLSGVKDTEYRVDNSGWVTGTSLSVPDEGNRTITYRSRDNVGNVETEKSINIIVDNTPPVSTVDFSQQNYTDGQNILVSKNTQVILSATDNLSGVKGTYYRFDDEDGWRTYTGAFRLIDLTFGTHTIRYRSSDNVENAEAEKSITVVLIGIDVKTGIMNLPRVLVWTTDPARHDDDDGEYGEESETKEKEDDEKEEDKERLRYTIDDIKAFIAFALNDPDIYFNVLTDKRLFIEEFRSGIYNMAVIVNQKKPLSEKFLRELKEGVNRGMGLLISGWKKGKKSELEEVLGVRFKGRLDEEDSSRPVYLYESPLSPEQSLTAEGKVEKTVLNGGTLAGIVKGEEVCDGIREVSFRYKTKVASGDTVKVSLYKGSEKKPSLVDEKTLYLSNLSSAGISTGNATGDISLDKVAPEGITFTIKASDEHLDKRYYISLSVLHQDGSITSTGQVAVTPTCSANLQAGMLYGPFGIIAVQADTHKKTDDVPAIVLNEYGQGKTVFLSYNIVRSALKRNLTEHAWVLKNATNYILPREAKPEAGGVTLLETRVKFQGTDMDLKGVDTLGDGLTHLPLFSLTRTPLEYTFHLNDGEETSYRYFVRIKDEIGSYGKDTDIYLGINGGYSLFDKYRYSFSIDTDSDLLMQQAVVWVNEQLSAHPESGEPLTEILNKLDKINFMPRLAKKEMEKVIHKTVKVIHHINKLPFDTTRGREIMDGYLRVMEGEFAK